MELNDNGFRLSMYLLYALVTSALFPTEKYTRILSLMLHAIIINGTGRLMGMYALYEG